jgi:hypothetical protein
VSRGRKVKRHACHVIGTCRKEGMERSSADAPPVRGPENIEAARERETNASEQFAAPGAAGRRETKEPCPMETAKSMGARETHGPIFWLGEGILPRRRDFNARHSPIVCLNFYQAPIFCIPT